MTTKITKSTFDSIVNQDKPVLIDFWAAWCGPCRAVTPIMEKLAKEYEGKAVVGKVNVDEENELAAKFGIRSIPTVVVMKNNKMVDQAVGVRAYETYASMIDDCMDE